MTADHIDRAAEVIAPVVWRDMQPDFVPSAPNDYDALTEEAQETVLHYTTMLAQALDAAGLLATPEHDAAVAAEAWDEGFATGQSRAMRHMSDEPLLPLSAPNPYEREAGESGANT